MNIGIDVLPSSSSFGRYFIDARVYTPEERTIAASTSFPTALTSINDVNGLPSSASSPALLASYPGDHLNTSSEIQRFTTPLDGSSTMTLTLAKGTRTLVVCLPVAIFDLIMEFLLANDSPSRALLADTAYTMASIAGNGTNNSSTLGTSSYNLSAGMASSMSSVMPSVFWYAEDHKVVAAVSCPDSMVDRRIVEPLPSSWSAPKELALMDSSLNESEYLVNEELEAYEQEDEYSGYSFGSGLMASSTAFYNLSELTSEADEEMVSVGSSLSFLHSSLFAHHTHRLSRTTVLLATTL